jgi:hypothetical protein
VAPPPLDENVLPPTEGIIASTPAAVPGWDLWPALALLAILMLVLAFVTPVPARFRGGKR